MNVGDVFRAIEVHAPEAERAIEKMDVAIDEAREHEAPARVDHFRVWLMKFFDFSFGADGNDFVALNRDCFRPRLFHV